MARWRLLEPHYITVLRDGATSEWAYKEINRANGREIVKKYPVPTHLDPKIQTDWTHRDMLGREQIGAKDDDGYIIVGYGEGLHPQDIILVKDAKGKLPITPGMEPLDDEARALSAQYNERIIPLEGRDDATYSERLLDKFIEQLAEAHTTASSASAGNVQGLGDVLKAMTEMMQQNQQILQALLTPQQQRPPEKMTMRRM